MKRTIYLSLLSMVTLGLCAGDEGQGPKNEVAFSLAGVTPTTVLDRPSVELGSGIGFQANYGRRLWSAKKFALYGEVNLFAAPQSVVTSSIASATHDVASLYITPGVRLKFMPGSRISPFVLIGGGYGDYEQSTLQIDGKPNPAPRQVARGVFDFGAGFDVRVWRWVALRGEARDYFTGTPVYNVAGISGGQHNLAASGGFVIRWH